MVLGVAVAALGWMPGIGVLLGWAAWIVASALLAVIDISAGLPGAVVAVGQAPSWLSFGWYAVLGCWVASRSADARALGLRPEVLRALAAFGLAVMVVGLVPGWAGIGRIRGLQVVLLDIEPAAAFLRTPDGHTALVTTGGDGQGLVASVGSQLDLVDSTIDVVIGPDQVRSGVDLLALNDLADGAEVGPELERVRVYPGDAVELGDGVSVDVIDVRQVREGAVLDVVIRADDLAVLLPGPGAPSARWADVDAETVSIGRLPAAGLAWARLLPPRRWLLLVGEPGVERARGDSGVPFLARREYGAVDLTISAGAVSARTERCSGGQDCAIDLPAPIMAALAAPPTRQPAPTSRDSDSPDGSRVQSGRAGDGR
jgi:hypothetical protein